MRVLIAPMSVMSETSGPFSRVAVLCKKLLERGNEVALCAAEGINYHSIENVKNYYAPMPSPLGLPVFVGKSMLSVMKILGKQQKEKVNSFEEVLHITGGISKKHFYEDVACLRRAIQDFKPDVVYGEFRVSAIVASKLEKVKVVTGFSYPVQKSFACNPEYSTSVKKFLKENGLPSIESVLDIFDWADIKIVPSSFELEPIEDKKAVFIGPFSIPGLSIVDSVKNKIVVYMGYGTINPRTVINSMTKAFENTDYEVYIATKQVKPYKKNNIIVDDRFDFSKLMPEAVAYINHGGQNSIMTGLMYGIPQIVCPGNVFERRYNAASVAKLKAGVLLELEDFTDTMLKQIVDDFSKDSFYAQNAETAGKKLVGLGGVNKAVEVIESLT